MPKQHANNQFDNIGLQNWKFWFNLLMSSIPEINTFDLCSWSTQIKGPITKKNEKMSLLLQPAGLICMHIRWQTVFVYFDYFGNVPDNTS